MTATLNEGKLLVDYETGRVLRADDEVQVTLQFLDSHPFIACLARDNYDRTYFVGPDARRRALARSRGEGEKLLDAVEYEVHQWTEPGLLLRKKEDA